MMTEEILPDMVGKLALLLWLAFVVGGAKRRPWINFEEKETETR